jgi:hypothetical protein
MYESSLFIVSAKHGQSPINPAKVNKPGHFASLVGTIYTGSTSKNAEHGGFSFGDTNVGLMVSNPAFSARVLKTPVVTSQVAATIVKSLGLDPNALKSVRIERTETLPGLP